MKTKDLIARLKQCPQEAEIYFNDGKGGLIRVETAKIESADKLKRRGIESESSGVILSDFPVSG